jgi:Tfp pilus assembly protein PilF
MRRAGFGCLDRLEHARGVSPALMADVYTLLGSKLQAAGSSNASGDSFRRAVRLDPKLGSARLGLGIYYDQLGHPKEAVNEFDDIPAVQPFQGEAWLRKAVAQIQLGRDQSAQRTLEVLVDPKAPSQPEPWVQSVAFQELAMLRLRQDGPQAARDVLQQAIRRLPQERRPYLLLAFVHNTLGQRAAAAGVMRDMEKHAQTDEGSSPRHRLAQWRLEISIGLEDRLRRQAIDAVATGKLGP